MSTANDNDKIRDPADIQTSIEHTRDEMSATIDAIQRRLTPGQLMDQGLGYLRHSLPADFGANLANTVRDNPVPVTLIGLGVAWLAMSGQSTGGYMQTRRPAAGERSAGDGGASSTLHRAATATGEAAGSISDKASEMAGRARDMARDARDRVSNTAQRVTSTAHNARDRLHDLSERSQDQYDRARRTVSTLFDEQPLVMGALGVAIGAALGAALPATRTEDDLMGRASDDLVDNARTTAGEYAERAKESVRDVVDQVAEKVDSGSADATTRAAAPATPHAGRVPG